MADELDVDIQNLLSNGLELYGDGRVSEAIQVWQKVLAADPDNGEAKDYLSTADRRKARRSSDEIASAAAAVLVEARALMAEGEFRGAFSLLNSASGSQCSSFDLEATLDLIRARLLREYRDRIGDLDAVPRASGKPDALSECDLPPSAGFLLSLADGATSFADLVSISGMDSFDAFRTMETLLDVGLLEVQS